ncbi:ABC transporter permease [Clostridioides sp. ES-S-0005-03]|uniref:ABC transporter permease n=1 Tax=Clostridioides sp. ES-S-0005-03 TaxID=2770774 RepID=UPI001D11CBA4|nr:ABC transporter permease [Clostridioides sp. ES-S-0005-03]UDN48173.1 ABC transporter permease [Clostridioides sp. ES-S-0173-01]
MLRKSVLGEILKLKNSFIWYILLALPLLSVLIGTGNFYLNQDILKKEWYSLWTQVSLFYGEFFFPILIAIFCAYVCRLEHMNHNWNNVMTLPINLKNIFLSKLIVISILTAITQIVFVIFYIVAGNMIGFSQSVPNELPGWIVKGWIISISIASIQLYLSIKIRSFATPIGISLCLSLFGMGLLIAQPSIGIFFPYSMLGSAMGIIKQSALNVNDTIVTICVAFATTIIFSEIAKRNFRKNDVIS